MVGPDGAEITGHDGPTRLLSRLADICAVKREEVAGRKTRTSLDALDRQARQASASRGFRRALEDGAASGMALIAEIKKASPSKGLIRNDFHPAHHALAYQHGGATCLSVLTDAPHFQGHEDHLRQARAACSLPVLRKDFTLDPWQVAEARAIGADAVLLIVAALEDDQMRELEAAASERGMDVLVEVHDEAQMERASALQTRLVGINNRDLAAFTTDLATTCRLAPLAPPGALLVSESGIATQADCARLAKVGVRALLVGESLMREPDIEAATRRLLGA